LRAYLDRFYLHSPHAGILGRTPASAYQAPERMPVRIDEEALRLALTLRESRRIRRDTTFMLHGVDYELEQGYLAGRMVTIAYCWLDVPTSPWVEIDGRTFPAHRVDPIANAHRKRPPRREQPDKPQSPVMFDPSIALTAQEVNLDNIF